MGARMHRTPCRDATGHARCIMPSRRPVSTEVDEVRGDRPADGRSCPGLRRSRCSRRAASARPAGHECPAQTWNCPLSRRRQTCGAGSVRRWSSLAAWRPPVQRSSCPEAVLASAGAQCRKGVCVFRAFRIAGARWRYGRRRWRTVPGPHRQAVPVTAIWHLGHGLTRGRGEVGGCSCCLAPDPGLAGPQGAVLLA